MDASTVTHEGYELTYDEMLEVAQHIHPAAQVRPISRHGVRVWEIYVKTAVEEVRELSSRFLDTPAWKAANEVDSSGVDKLSKYSKKNNYDDLPIDCAGDYFNLDASMREMYAEAMKENGGNASEAMEELSAQFTGMRVLLDMNWLDD